MNDLKEVIDMGEYILSLRLTDKNLNTYVHVSFYNVIHWTLNLIKKCFGYENTELTKYWLNRMSSISLAEYKQRIKYELHYLHRVNFPFDKYEKLCISINKILEYIDIVLIINNLTT